MFAVKDILVSDDVLDARFACDLASCLGGCCVHGDSGAPLEPGERHVLEAILPKVRRLLRPEALAVIDQNGVWEEKAPGEYATVCVGSAECVFVTYDGPVAKCAIQKQFDKGRVDFEKPISCHLFPVRITKREDQEFINYDRIGLCTSAVVCGEKKGVDLVSFLRDPLIRKYGKEWFDTFRETVRERRRALSCEAAEQEER
jgi:hypothetical protein